MKRKFLLIALGLSVLIGCGSSSSSSEPIKEITNYAIERDISYQNISLSQSQILSPYGIKVKAEIVSLELLVSTSHKEPQKRIADIKHALDTISEQVSNRKEIDLEQVSLNQVQGSYAREEKSESNIPNINVPSIDLILTTNLDQHNDDFMQAVFEFNDFLAVIQLPDTIKITVVSVEATLGNVDKYRDQLIEQVYKDLNSVKDEYSSTVKFDISGLYDPLQLMQVNDVEYYLYIEPNIQVIDY